MICRQWRARYVPLGARAAPKLFDRRCVAHFDVLDHRYKLEFQREACVPEGRP
jgi:hypothetical protein